MGFEEMSWIGERRLVTRFPVPEVPLTLAYERRGVFRARSTASLYAVMLDISAVGAQIIAPVSQHLVLRSLVEIELAGDKGTGMVRSIQPHAGNEARYGIEFLDMPPRFKARILALAERASLERPRA